MRIRLFGIVLLAALQLAFSDLHEHEHEHKHLHEIFDDYWAYQLSVNPYLAGNSGITEANAQLPDASTEALQAREAAYQTFLSRLQEVSYERLTSQDQISYRLFERQLRNGIEAHALREYLLPLNGWWDYHATFAEQPNRMPFSTVRDYENYLSRLQAFPAMNAQYLGRLRMGIEAGVVRPRVVLENYIPTVEALISEEAADSRFMLPFERFPASVSEAERTRLREEALRIIGAEVLPAYRELAAFLRDEYYAATPEAIGISQVPGGAAYYEYLVRFYTTLDVSAGEIHQTGLAEVARIRAEMLEVIEETGFEGDFDEFVTYLRTDPKFYAQSAEELMMRTALVLKQMDGALPGFFGRLPRMPYGLREVPAYLAPRMTTAYYNSPSQDGTRAGFYFVNTYDLPSRPLYEIEALSFHEAVPGHHLQLALQQELEGLPEFRRNSSVTVFVEGWALYAEWLGLEMGFYQDPYSNFGRLTYEMWRALRLVVDTGIHAKGWTRQQAIDYMAENSALTLLNIRNEVDRYIFWPGQALAYKTGEIKIRELRREAEEALGDSFDIRAFHDMVLANGSITLEVLEQEVRAWIDDNR
ncbi:Uncharacterized conserved protein, DUF885 familyt [Cyclonatronum proteinivorum]|uniref:Uncharacterized conserved protein, DUF885 familyt n=1 Tax=Cyclonatronum proteinivorum TaxID=1457365 RepID=A0A345UGH5_9BACT|nr:DUF885 domain-containing protein [Cyclonatronum proteinivorum]AXI99576.1 Uncharacterized conserved protein, DUF885 familyt [Cyclonatronum proteinivorum]